MNPAENDEFDDEHFTTFRGFCDGVGEWLDDLFHDDAFLALAGIAGILGLISIFT